MTKEELFGLVHPEGEVTDRAKRDKAYIDKNFERLNSDFEVIKQNDPKRPDREVAEEAIKFLKMDEVRANMPTRTFDKEDLKYYDFQLLYDEIDLVYDYIEDAHKPGTMAQVQGFSEDRIVSNAIMHAKAEVLLRLVRQYRESIGANDEMEFTDISTKIRSNVDKLYHQYKSKLDLMKFQGQEIKTPEEEGKVIMDLVDDPEKEIMEMYGIIHSPDDNSEQAMKDKKFMLEHQQKIAAEVGYTRRYSSSKSEEQIVKFAISKVKFDILYNLLRRIDPEDRPFESSFETSLLQRKLDELYDFYEGLSEGTKEGPSAVDELRQELTRLKKEELLETIEIDPEKATDEDKAKYEMEKGIIESQPDEVFFRYHSLLNRLDMEGQYPITKEAEHQALSKCISEMVERGKTGLESGQPVNVETLAALSDEEFVKVITEMATSQLDDETFKLIADIIKKASELRTLKREREAAEKSGQDSSKDADDKGQE